MENYSIWDLDWLLYFQKYSFVQCLTFEVSFFFFLKATHFKDKTFTGLTLNPNTCLGRFFTNSSFPQQAPVLHAILLPRIRCRPSEVGVQGLWEKGAGKFRKQGFLLIHTLVRIHLRICHSFEIRCSYSWVSMVNSQILNPAVPMALVGPKWGP